MRTTHELQVIRTCPVDKTTHDVYAVTITVDDRVLRVEEILQAVGRLRDPIFQEALTEELARALDAKVTTVGQHSGVSTTCMVDER